VGKYPLESVAMMDSIIHAVETDETYWEDLYMRRKEPIAAANHMLSNAARDIARVLPAHAIFAFTRTGASAFAAARERAYCPLYALTPDVSAARRLSLVWGVMPVVSPEHNDSDTMLAWAEGYARDELKLAKGAKVVVLAGTPFGVSGTTNTLKIITV